MIRKVTISLVLAAFVILCMTSLYAQMAPGQQHQHDGQMQQNGQETWMQPEAQTQNGQLQQTTILQPADLQRTDRILQGKAFREGQVRDFRLRFTSASGNNFEGNINWPSLNLTNRVTGTIQGDRITFHEVRRMGTGRDQLLFTYSLQYRQADNAYVGCWVDPCTQCRGFAALGVCPPTVAVATPEPVPVEPITPVTPEPPPAAPPQQFTFQGEIEREKFADTPFTLTMATTNGTAWNGNGVNGMNGTQVVEGTINYPTMRSQNQVRGEMVGDTITFTEVAYVQQGAAPLQRTYRFTRVPGTNRYTGIWFMNGDARRGAANLTMVSP